MPSLVLPLMLQILLISFTVLQESAQAKTSKLWFRDGGKSWSIADVNKQGIYLQVIAMEVCYEGKFGLIHALFLSLGSTKSVYFIWDTR